MADGSVRLDVDLSLNKAEKQLQTLKGKITKLESEVNKNTAKKGLLEDQMRVTGAQLDDAIDRVKYLKEKVASTKGDQKALYKEELAEAVEEQSILSKEANRINSEYDKVTGSITKGREKLAEMTKEAGEMEKAIIAARPGERIKEGISDAKKGFKNLLKYAVGIRSLYILVNKIRTGITEGFKDFASKDPETKKNINDLKASLSALRGAWGAAFAPIVNAVTPLLKTLIGWLTAAGNAVARFIAILTGKSTYKKAVANADNYADSLGGVADKAKEARKQLMGIDELTIFSSDKTSGGGGGSSSGGADYVETPTNAGDLSFGSRLAMTVRDVFFDWGDWNAEKILQKAIVAISASEGAYVGWKLGGFKGAVIGGVLGTMFGIAVDASSINGDGELDIGEVVKSILPVGATLLGTATGHPIIGFTVGLALTFMIEKNLVDTTELERTADEIGRNVAEKGILGGLAYALKGPVKSRSIEELQAYIASLDEEYANAEPGSEQLLYYLRIRAIAVNELEKAGIESGQALIQGTNEGIKIEEDEDEEASFAKRLVNWVKNLLGIHSPSTVFRDIGVNIITGLLQGITDRWGTFQQNITGKFNDLKSKLSNIVERIKSLFNFQFKLPQLKLPHISVSWQDAGSALAKFLGISSIPHLSVSWYKRGGIVDGATLIGAGEAGKEAIIPLERNTEWINLVADGIIERITSSVAIERLASAFSRVPLPAMANGAVIPPNATARAGGLSDEGMAYLISQITSAVYANANLVVKAISSLDLSLDVDGVELARKLWNANKTVANEHGGSLINIGSR